MSNRRQTERIDELLKKVRSVPSAVCCTRCANLSHPLVPSQTEHFDADERYMAVHDLMDDIKGEGEIEAKDVARIRDTLVTLLNDKSGDVSTIATKRSEPRSFGPQRSACSCCVLICLGAFYSLS